VWTLVDADAGWIGSGSGFPVPVDLVLHGTNIEVIYVPVDLVLHGTNLEVIYVSSPQRARWKRLVKMTRPTVCLMEAWTREEMRQLYVFIISFLPSRYRA